MRRRYSELGFLLSFSTSLKKPLLTPLRSASSSCVSRSRSRISLIRSPTVAICGAAYHIDVPSAQEYAACMFALQCVKYLIANSEEDPHEPTGTAAKSCRHSSYHDVRQLSRHRVPAFQRAREA